MSHPDPTKDYHENDIVIFDETYDRIIDTMNWGISQLEQDEKEAFTLAVLAQVKNYYELEEMI